MEEARGTAMGNGNDDSGGGGGGGNGNDGQCQQWKQLQQWPTSTTEMVGMMANVNNGDGRDDGRCQLVTAVAKERGGGNNGRQEQTAAMAATAMMAGDGRGEGDGNRQQQW